MSKFGLGLVRAARLTRRQLIMFALASAVLNGVVTACIGAWLAQTYTTQQTRRKSVETLANLVYERRTRAGMVVSSMRRNAPMEEIQYRKRAYDEAFVDWNKNILLNLFVIREVSGDLRFTALEKSFEDDLVATMADIDRCLTKAYDKKLVGEDVTALLDACQMAQMHQLVLNCGATFTDELYKLTRLSFSPFGESRTERKRLAAINIRANCTRPVDVPTQKPPPSQGPVTGTVSSAPATSPPALAGPEPPPK